MYLMNVPPVAATRTEWRTCGTPRGYSLPICFNDSDTEVSTRGTPVSDKVQMIIESLRSTQSSLEMGDEIEGNVLSEQEDHPHVCKVSMGSFVGPKSKGKDPTESQKAEFSSPIYQERHDSDSDDSVDRGIEEAILEYLKEKDDHKRKAEPCTNSLQSSKIPRKSSPTSEVSTQHSGSNTFLFASSQFPKSIKVESPTSPAVIPMKKFIKNKAFLDENPVQKMYFNKMTTTSTAAFIHDQTNPPSKTNSIFSNVKFPVRVKVEEDSSDSSSDDGIEEAIQRYQLEKMEQQIGGDGVKPQALKEESDSTSDDGIEEAIRCYQLQQLKEKRPFLHKQSPASKSLIHAAGSTEYPKKPKFKKKKNRAEKEAKPVLTPASPGAISKDSPSESPKGIGLLSFKEGSFAEEQISTPPKVNTTAELMCAEAILDISKAVMPVGFHHDVGLISCAPVASLSLPGSKDDGSDDSSIDSEDGIEQEIRRFLEQKAQMQQQPSGSSAMAKGPVSANDPDKVKPKQTAQKKPSRLSLTQKRRFNEEACCVTKESAIDDKMNEAALKPTPEHGKESSLLVLTQRNQALEITQLQKFEPSGDKSSSLDSDEDLDTAIKDLLKTKKKSKKKTKDLKRKPRKCLKDEGQPPGDALETKKLKPVPISKRKTKDDAGDKCKLSKNILQYKQTNERKEQRTHEGETVKGGESRESLLLHNTQATLQINEDSSSVDSDDSIELEIRKFLAEKAKVSNVEKNEEVNLSSNGNVLICTPPQDRDITQENQLAEIPTKSVSPSPGQRPLCISTPDAGREPIPPSPMLDNYNYISTVSTSPRLSSVLARSPSLLEPADGAGAARAEQRKAGAGGIQDVAAEVSKPQLVLSADANHFQSIKWRQSLGLPTTDLKRLSRTPFQITSSKIGETAPAAMRYQGEGVSRKPQTPVTVWSTIRNSRPLVPLPSSSEKSVNTMYHSPVSNLMSTTRRHSVMSFAQRPAPGACRAQCPVEGETKSTVHMAKDQSVFVELETNRTNHVQVRSREISEGKEREGVPSETKRGESKRLDDKDVHLERTDEDFVDETDCESDRRSPEKKQGFSTL
ncbi:protein phosphatase 1 regulatory subunit 26 isoform X2 [Genypterus blacodes]